MHPVKPAEPRASQFVQPHGFIGRLAGHLMAAFNSDMERAAIDALPLDSRDSVLEIGFGPGIGIRYLTKRLPDGAVAGIDPSPVMLAQASHRNRRAVQLGHVDLRLGTSSQLPWNDAHFHAACSVNNVQLWPSLADDLGEVRRVLQRGGFLSIAVHAWVDKYAQDRGDAGRPWREHIVAALQRGRFHVTNASETPARSGRALYFLAQAP